MLRMKISVLFLMLIIISGISLIGINQAFALFCSSNVAGSWNAPSTWTGCGGGVPDDTGDTAFINQNGDVQLNNNFVVGSVEIIQGGNLFINCNGELIITFVAESGSNAGLLTNHGILQTLTQVDFTNTGTYQSSGTDIFGGSFIGNPIVPIASICPVCGDGIMEGTEECDDGNTMPGDGCNEFCMFEGPICGDGIVEPPEACDPPDGITCDDQCGNIECGDGIVQPPEQCDPPDGITCDSQCMLIFVGGELIPLDTTSLLLAGAQMNAAWMIPVIVSAIGIGIVIARKF